MINSDSKNSMMQNQEKLETLSKGTQVEVTRNDNGPAWYKATILKPPNKVSSVCVVQYQNLQTKDGTKPLNETVNLASIRPLPPCETNNGFFEKNDVVDAFYNGAWWTGVVSRVVEGENMKFYVNLDAHCHISQFESQELRPHHDWIHGIWVLAEKINPVSRIAQKIRDMGGQKRKGTSNPDMDIRLGSSCAIRNIMGQKTPSPMMRKTMMGQPHDHDHDHSNASTTRDRKAKLSALESISRTSCRNKRFIEGNSSESSRLSETVRGRKRPLDTFSEDNLNALVATKLGNTQVKRSRNSGIGNNLSLKYESPLSGKVDNKPKAVQGSSKVTSRSSGRPLKSAVKMPNSAGTKTSSKDVAVTGEPRKRNRSGLKEQVMTRSQPLNQEKNMDDSTVGESMQIEEKSNQKRKRGRPRKLDIGSRTSLEKGLSDKNAVAVSVSKTREGKMAAAGLFSKPADERMTLSVIGDAFLGWVVEQHSEATGRPLEAATKQHRSVNSLSDNMPFVKSSPLWNALKGLEVFKSHSQKPHFHPLSKCKEEHREGNAIGMMVIYSCIVEKVSKLNFDDPKSTFTSVMEDLPNLENNGFDVIALRARVNDLLKVKNLEVQVKDESKDVKSKILQLTHDEENFGMEIGEIEKEIYSLQQKLVRAKSRKETALAEIDRLQSRVEDLNAIAGNYRLEFQKLARSPL